jgi:serine/threonine-protein kinase
MLDPQTSRFWQATLLSGLMDAEALTACWNRIPLGKREEPEHIDRRLARQAVQMDALTVWQAQQLLAGRTGGYKVDRYVLLDLIGQGGMGRVYLARDTRLHRRVALKILSPERVNNPRAIARFQREARVGAQLQHENLVRVYDFGESNARYYLVMEYIDGKTIGNLISEQGPMPPAAAARLVRQVALGLEHVHRKGLIHRDVNPYNIMVTHDGTAKLADMGLAIDVADENRVTSDGATVGTFDYVAPEQARHSHAADIRSDIYSLGCTFYHMIGGQVPFPGSSLSEKLLAHQAIEPTSLSELAPGLGPGLAEIVRRMMRKSPDERYATPMQVAQALEPYSEEYAGASADNDTSRIRRERTTEAEALTPRTDPAEVRTVLASAIEPDRSLLQTVALHSELNSPTTAPTNPVSLGNTANPATALVTPDDGTDETEAGIPFVLNLGPEPSLSEGLSRPKSRSGSDSSTTTTGNSALARWSARFRLWGLVALAMTVTVTVLVAALAARDRFSARLGESETDRSSNPNAATQPSSSRHVQATSKGDPAIVVRFEDGEEIPFDDLRGAFTRALGTSAWVELRTAGPFHLAGDQSLAFGDCRGRLKIRAAPAVMPVIEVELRDLQPCLQTGSAVLLELSGLTFVVRYLSPSGSASPAPPPLIAAAGKTTKIDHCAFRVVGNPRLKDACAIVSDGGSLEVDRCWFQGFDPAITISTLDAVDQIPARIHQTMIVPSPESGRARPQLAEPRGWGVKVLASSPESRLILDHCTFDGAGLLDLTGRPLVTPIQIEVKHCAVRADALLAWKPDRLDDSLADQLHWRGSGNQYDILGRSWIVPSTSQAAKGPSIGIIDLSSWMHVATKDENAIATKLEFVTDPSAQSDSFQPRNFAIKESATRQAKPGADPELVGPWARR